MSDFTPFFLQITDNFVIFLDEKRKVKKYFKILKKLEMLKVDEKIANLSTLPNFDVMDKNGCPIRNQRLKINKV